MPVKCLPPPTQEERDRARAAAVALRAWREANERRETRGQA